MMKTTKGITLVALVITIIILLILAGISIQAITQTNLFGQAQQAKEKMDNAQKEENDTLSSYADKINEYLKEETLADKVSNGEIEIGAYVNYIPDEVTSDNQQYKELISNLATYSGNTDEEENTTETIRQEKLKWRVLDVKDGQVRLISAMPTETEIYLEYYNGYNNEVKLIDDTCSTLYNNRILASKVQNLKIEDIQDKMKEKDYSKLNEDYGKVFTFTTKNKYYPNILLKEKDQEITIGEEIIKGTELGQSEQNEYVKQEEINKQADILKIKSTCWSKKMEKADFDNSKYFELFINNGNKNYDYYWLSSRFIDENNDCAEYGVYNVAPGCVMGTSFYSYSSYVNPNDDRTPSGNAFRPVITLKSNVQIDTSNPGDGTENNAYNIK